MHSMAKLKQGTLSKLPQPAPPPPPPAASSASRFASHLHLSSPVFHIVFDLLSVISVVTDACSVLFPFGGGGGGGVLLLLSLY